MSLGLVPGVRTQGQGWSVQEVHHCATHVMIAYREKNGRIYTALCNTKAVNEKTVKRISSTRSRMRCKYSTKRIVSDLTHDTTKFD